MRYWKPWATRQGDPLRGKFARTATAARRIDKPEHRAPSVVLGRRREIVLKTALIIEKRREKRAFPEARFGGTADAGLARASGAQSGFAWQFHTFAVYYASRLCVVWVVRVRTSTLGPEIMRFLQSPPIVKPKRPGPRRIFHAVSFCKDQTEVLEPESAANRRSICVLKRCYRIV